MVEKIEHPHPTHMYSAVYDAGHATEVLRNATGGARLTWKQIQNKVKHWDEEDLKRLDIFPSCEAIIFDIIPEYRIDVLR